MTNTTTEFRKEILDKIGISYDYYPASESTDRHCRWVCTDINCNGASYKSFPAFLKHINRKHGIYFTILNWMRNV